MNIFQKHMKQNEIKQPQLNTMLRDFPAMLWLI